MINDTQRGGLFSPVRLGAVELPNRIVMAPMTRNRAGGGGVPQDLNILYYTQRASAGLIITEATQVSDQGIGYPATPGMYTSAQVAGWKRLVDAVHEKGGRIFMQLFHCGRISHPSFQPGNGLPVAPSAIKPAGDAFTYSGLQPYVAPRALETDEIAEVVGQFRHAAECARGAGFDGVEIHGANGYLLDQFVRDGSNQRTDRYGGAVENRARLLLEVVESVSDVWGAGRVGVRISPINSFNDMSDSDPAATFGYVAHALNRFALAYLHVLEGDMADPTASLDYGALRAAFQGPYMANGGYDKARAEEAINSGKADAVSFGALFIANPDLPARLQSGAELAMPDPATFYGGNEKGYTDYPFLNNNQAEPEELRA